MLSEQDFQDAAQQLGCDAAAVKAVCAVEAPSGGFDGNGLVRILFEAHRFGKLTAYKYNSTHPTISAPNWDVGKQFYSKGLTADIRNGKEWKRLNEAMLLARDAAIQSASFGKFQIMGFNYAAAGFESAEAFFTTMQFDEAAHLRAFVSFLKKDRGGAAARALKAHNWALFASLYNGSGYKANDYDGKLLRAWEGLT